jgi:putative transposase
VGETTVEFETAAGVGDDGAGQASAGTSDEQLIAMLVGRARGDGLQLSGEGGLQQQLTKRVLESALEGELTDCFGYEKHDSAGKRKVLAEIQPDQHSQATRGLPVSVRGGT